MDHVIVLLAAMVSVVVLELAALVKGYNGRVLQMALLLIGVLAGASVGDFFALVK